MANIENSDLVEKKIEKSDHTDESNNGGKILTKIADYSHVFAWITILGVILFVFFWILAMIFYTDGYDFFNEVVSNLGRDLTPEGANNFYPQFFLRLAFYSLGIGGISIYFIMFVIYRNHKIKDIRIWSLLGSIAGVIALILLIWLGYLPLDTMTKLHNDVASSMYLFTIIAIGFYSVVEYYRGEAGKFYFIPAISVLLTTFAYLYLPADIPILRDGNFQEVMQKISLICILLVTANFALLILKLKKK